MTTEQIWVILHGAILGGGLLVLFSLAWGAIWLLGKGQMTEDKRLPLCVWAVAGLCWFACLSGTFQIYPAYGAKDPNAPKARLKADPETKFWHSFVMEWKEHVAWLAVFLTTGVAFMVTRYRRELSNQAGIRRAVHVMFCTAFVASAIAGFLGVLVNKAAPFL